MSKSVKKPRNLIPVKQYLPTDFYSVRSRMAWKKGNKLVFKKEWLTEYPHMKGKRVTFLHCHPQLKSCIVLKIRYGRMVVEEVWHKSYWEKEEIT